jgi:hypothetical protein
MKNKKHDTVETVPRYNGKILQRGKLDAPKRTILPPWYRHFNKKKRGGANLVLWDQTLAF